MKQALTVDRHKLILIGETNVGKSSLMVRISGKSWDPYSCSTIGMAFSAHDVVVKDKMVHLECWDSAGQERFHSIVPMYFKNVDVVLLVYDVSQPWTSQKLLDHWLPEIKSYFGKTLPHLFIVGNKYDLLSAEERMDSSPTNKLLKELCQVFSECAFSCQGCFTSALENQGVVDLFHDVAIKISETPSKSGDSTPIAFKDTPDVSQEQMTILRSCCHD